MIQPIYLYGSEVLRKKAEEVDLGKKDEIKALVQDLKDTLANADGCGLAAPQIGVSKRVVIVDGTGMEDVYDYLKDFRRTLINPVISRGGVFPIADSYLLVVSFMSFFWSIFSSKEKAPSRIFSDRRL